MSPGCPLCGSLRTESYHRDRRRDYLRCRRCALVFVPPAARPARGAELAEYCRHRNALDDAGYRRFLERLALPLLQRLPAAARGLDFGCGPAPLLVLMLAEHGHRVVFHDRIFCPAPWRLQERYQFVTASEVVEHLHRPGAELQQLWRCLLPGGWLAVMTKLLRDRAAFAGWHYIRDPTHVCFFSRDTWCWWAQQRGARLQFHGADVILMQKPGG